MMYKAYFCDESKFPKLEMKNTYLASLMATIMKLYEGEIEFIPNEEEDLIEIHSTVSGEEEAFIVL